MKLEVENEQRVVKSRGKHTAPGPQGHPLLGVAPEFGKDIIQTLLDGWQTYGDVVYFRSPFPNVPQYLIAHPDAIKYILQDNQKNYRHPRFQVENFESVVGKGLVASQGKYWLRQRRLVQPIFNRQRLAKLADLMTDTIAEMLTEWETHIGKDSPLDIRVEMQRVTLTVLARAVFRTDWSPYAEAIGKTVSVQLWHAFHGMLSPVHIPERIPTPENRRFLAARRQLDSIIYRLIAESKNVPGDDGSLFAMMSAARDEETGEGMSDQQLRDEIMSLLIAGHETVSTGLTWTWYLLSKNPHAWRRVVQEVDEVLGDRVPTYEDLPRLKYTAMVIEEAMRLYPPLWVTGRMPIEDDEVGGHRIPAGSILLLSQYITHRHPDFWPNPEGFDPDRFEPESVAQRHRYAHFPYGGGQRKCVGAAFATMEMPFLIAMAVQRFRLSLVPGHRIVLQPGISLRSKYGMKMHLEKRDPLQSRTIESALPSALRLEAAPTTADGIGGQCPMHSVGMRG